MKTIDTPGTATICFSSDDFNQNWFPIEYWSPDFQQTVKSELDRLAGLQNNWDGERAPAIAKNVIDAAKVFLDRLPEHIAPIPAVVPMATGNLQFEWNDSGRSLEIEFENQNEIHYLKWAPSLGIEEEGIFPVNDLNSAVALIRWLTGTTMNA